MNEKGLIQKEVLEMIKRSQLKAAISQINTMKWNKTGSWRVFKPLYKTKDAPCKIACPAMENIPVWIDLIKRGKIKDAWQVYISENPLPAILGRVCFKFCEAKCNRAAFDYPIAINALERFLGDQALANNWRSERTKEDRQVVVYIIGAGPAGLSAAYFLRQKGFSVIIYEASDDLGGMLKFGIPDYRLPKTVLWQEIQNNILSLGGIQVCCGQHINRENLDLLRRNPDAWIIIATGAHVSKKLGIEGENLPGVMTGLEFLKRVKMESTYGDMGVGPRVAVIGGGNTAIDAARSALRLEGVREVMIIYRRSKDEMPAHREEVEQAEAEGVRFNFLTAPVKIRPGIMENILECQTMALGEPDASGRKRPIPVEGSEFEFAIDTIIKAIGEESNASIIFTTGNNVLVIGDASSGPASVAEAIAAGKKAARIISGETEKPPAATVNFGMINIDYFGKTAKTEVIKTSLGTPKDFREVNLGIDLGAALKEASRCFSCGTCNSCDNCYSFCPDGAVIKTSSGYEINYDFCKGCLICFKECPGGVINFEKEGG